MYKHILIPTDGSETSKRAIQEGIAFARDSGATVTGLYVMPEYSIYAYQAEMLVDVREDFDRECKAYAEKCLAEIKDAAAKAGVTCDTRYVTNAFPYEAIIETAQERKCDLIAMASHGRKGVKGFLLGSETQKVLTHSKIPVLVYR